MNREELEELYGRLNWSMTVAVETRTERVGISLNDAFIFSNLLNEILKELDDVIDISV